MKIGSQTLSMLQQKIVKSSVHLKSVASFPYWLQRNCKGGRNQKFKDPHSPIHNHIQRIWRKQKESWHTP